MAIKESVPHPADQSADVPHGVRVGDPVTGIPAGKDLFGPLKQAFRDTCGLSPKVEAAFDGIAAILEGHSVEQLAAALAEAADGNPIDGLELDRERAIQAGRIPVERNDPEEGASCCEKCNSSTATKTAIMGVDALTMFHEWLEAAGIVRPGDQVRRVVLDIPLNDIVTVHVERMPGPELLTVKPPAVRVLRPTGNRAGLMGHPAEENAIAGSPTSEAAALADQLKIFIRENIGEYPALFEGLDRMAGLLAGPYPDGAGR